MNWVVMKFGGSSLASYKHYLNCLSIITKNKASTKLGVVFSASYGITNKLVKITNNPNINTSLLELENVFEWHSELIENLKFSLSNHSFERLNRSVKAREVLAKSQLQTLINHKAIYGTAHTLLDEFLTLGERLSVDIMTELLSSKFQNVKRLNADQIIAVENTKPNLDKSKVNITPYLQNVENQLLVMEGFYGADSEGKIVSLGRDGSDLSAIILGKIVFAKQIEIWTDVDGILSANPNIVSEPKTLPKLSFEKARLMSKLGASVIYEKAVCESYGLESPIIIRNSLNVESLGTKIYPTSRNIDSFDLVITSIEKVLIESNGDQAFFYSQTQKDKTLSLLFADNIENLAAQQFTSRHSIAELVLRDDLSLLSIIDFAPEQLVMIKSLLADICQDIHLIVANHWDRACSLVLPNSQLKTLANALYQKFNNSNFIPLHEIEVESMRDNHNFCDAV